MTAFEDVTVFDGDMFLEHQTVTLDGSTIASIAAARSHTSAIRTVLPGFIDAHVHLGFFDVREVLSRGVTTVRDLGWPLGGVPMGGPDVLFAGAIITARGGYPSRAAWAPDGTAREIDNDDDARAAVRSMATAGASIIKIAQEPRQGPIMPMDVLRAIVEEARAHSVAVTSHCGSLAELERALDAGVAELAHGLWSDEEIPDEVIARMIAANVTIVPTLHIDPSEPRIGNTKRFVEAGGRVVYGTDMGNPPVPGGIDADEIALMQRAGLSLEHALAAATSRAAQYLGLHDRGRIAVDMRADLIVIDGDVRTDLRALEKPSVVLKNGVHVR